MTTTLMPNNTRNLPDAEPPKILSDLEISSETIDEGEPVRIELQIAQTTDLEITWLKEGQPLSAGSRFDSSLERGFANLDILYTNESDSGTYSCIIQNKAGQIQSKTVSLKVIPEEIQKQVDFDDKFAEVNYESAVRTSELESRAMPTQAPSFTKAITISENEVIEGVGVRFEGQLAHAFDSTRVIEWFKDGKEIGTGSRFNIISDRDLVALEIAYCFKDDTGSYVCKVKNSVGQIESQPIQLNCIPEERVATHSILDEHSIQQLKAFDDPGESANHGSQREEEKIQPAFLSDLEPTEIEVDEDSEINISASVTPGNGSVVVLSWFKNSEAVHYSSRINGDLDRGMVNLRIKYLQSSDTGEYYCQLSSEHGTVTSNVVMLKCRQQENIISTSQLKGERANGLQAIHDLETTLNLPKVEEKFEEKEIETPSIVRQPEEIGEIDEGSGVHFGVLFEPAHDTNLMVEWFKDDKPLTSGTRFRVDYERGLATLDIIYTIQEDTGAYWCLGRNNLGQIKSNQIQITCKGDSEVITQSNLLQGSDGYKLIQAIEEGPLEEDVKEYEADVEPESKPHFDQSPTTLLVSQGSSAKFLVRITGNPTPDIEWTIDDEPIKTDSNVKLYKDGPINYLEINRCDYEHGSHKLKIVASNKLGTAEAETILSVSLNEDFRPDLKHVKMANPFRKIGLKKVEVDQELNKAFQKAKPTAESLMKMERGSEIKAKTFKSPEVLEAENILDKVAVNLRKSEAKKHLVSPEQ